MRRILPLLRFILPLALLGPVLAQSVRWDPPGGQLGFNQVSQLSLVFEDCEPDGDPALPNVDGLQVLGRPSQSSQTTIVNFKMTQTFSLVYPVRPNKRAPVTIPTFEIKTDKGAIKVPAAKFTVGDAPVGNSGLSVADISSATLETATKSVWAGEVFQVTYSLDVVRRYFHSLGSFVQWPSAPAVADEWTKPDPTIVQVRGEQRVLSNQTTRAMVKQPGVYSFKPASQLVNLMVGSTTFGLFTQPNVEQRQIDSTPLELTVKPLPTPPADFGGAVGEFAFISKVVPTSGAVGEPITWTLELSGTGNWPDIAGLPQREVSNDFQVVQPKSKRTMKDGTLFEGSLSEDVVLVPSKPGTYRLAPVRFTYFDPKSGSYKTIATEPVTLTVTGSTAPVQPPAASGAPVQFSLAPAANNPTLPTPTAPVPPENLPRDPLPAGRTGLTPVNLPPLAWICGLAALLPPLLGWLILAALRSRVLDPQRQRREARASLLGLMGQLRGATRADPVLLTQWQQFTATLWEVPHAAPGAPLVRTRVSATDATAADEWERLWAEADRALHGREGTLPTDWISRAETAAQATRIPGWSPFSLFAPANLLPFVVALAIALAPLAGRAATPAEDAYRKGDFAAASTEWSKDVAAAPRDWTARHNLGLALAQQDRWAEATAHWTAGILLNARADTTRWDLALGLQRSGLAQPDLVELSRGEGTFALARWATPGEWQAVLLGAALLLAAALVLLLLQGYRRIARWGAPTSLGLILIAVVLAAGATLSLHTYGQLADPGAVFVWEATTLRSVPTDADTAQKTSPLSAGSIAVADKQFLGWTKLRFTGGQTGWVRTETLVPLYRRLD